MTIALVISQRLEMGPPQMLQTHVINPQMIQGLRILQKTGPELDAALHDMHLFNDDFESAGTTKYAQARGTAVCVKMTVSAKDILAALDESTSPADEKDAFLEILCERRILEGLIKDVRKLYRRIIDQRIRDSIREQLVTKRKKDEDAAKVV